MNGGERMAIDASSLTSYSDSDLLTIYRWAMANGAAGQTRTINGRSVTFPALADMMKAIDWLEARVETAAATDAGGGNVLVKYGERV